MSLSLALLFVENATKENLREFCSLIFNEGRFLRQFISATQNKKNEKLICIQRHPKGCDEKLPKRKVPDEKSTLAQVNLLYEYILYGPGYETETELMKGYALGHYEALFTWPFLGYMLLVIAQVFGLAKKKDWTNFRLTILWFGTISQDWL